MFVCCLSFVIVNFFRKPQNSLISAYFIKEKLSVRTIQLKGVNVKPTPNIMITIRKVRMIRNVIQVQGGSWWLFFQLRPHVSYIFGKLGQYPVQWRWPHPSWSPSGRSGWSGMSSKYKEFLMIIFPIQTLCVIYFWKAWGISSSMKMTPPIMITISKVMMIRNILQRYREVQRGFLLLLFPN